ncbi:MAG: STAS domain-containing protein [Deltaproteobacteria bacterium]|nr:STAS domain-containing protein [Deltaproteobacteria bacterium]MBI3296055.1 STAS domain-containing protein [Deltaproteobacteria bacterium]
MNLRTRLDGNVLVFELEGNIDFESAMQFRDSCVETISKQNPQRIVFNLNGLKFVGSSAINQFIRVLRDLNSKEVKPRYCHLSSEFERLFRAYETARKPFEIYSSEVDAKASFDAPPAPRRRGRRPLTN